VPAILNWRIEMKTKILLSALFVFALLVSACGQPRRQHRAGQRLWMWAERDVGFLPGRLERDDPVPIHTGHTEYQQLL